MVLTSTKPPGLCAWHLGHAIMQSTRVPTVCWLLMLITVTNTFYREQEYYTERRSALEFHETGYNECREVGYKEVLRGPFFPLFFFSRFFYESFPQCFLLRGYSAIITSKDFTRHFMNASPLFKIDAWSRLELLPLDLKFHNILSPCLPRKTSHLQRYVYVYQCWRCCTCSRRPPSWIHLQS